MINTYSDLKAAIVDWSHRADITAKVDEFIQLAESEIRKDLVSRKIEKAVHGTFNGPIVQPPSDVEQIQRLMYYKDGREITPEYGAPASIEVNSRVPGLPRYWAQADQVIMLYPSPDNSYQYSLYYIPTLQSLSSASPTNWLLTTSPNCYLFKSLHFAAIWVKDVQEAEGYDAKYLKALQGVRAHSERSRYALGSSLTIRPRRSI